MNEKRVMNHRNIRTSRSRRPAWLVLLMWELKELWIGGKALILIILFSVLLGIMAWLLATNSELNLIPPKEMVFLTLQAAIAVGLFISLILALIASVGSASAQHLKGFF